MVDELIRQLTSGNPTIADLQAAVDFLQAHRFTASQRQAVSTRGQAAPLTYHRYRLKPLRGLDHHWSGPHPFPPPSAPDTSAQTSGNVSPCLAATSLQGNHHDHQIQSPQRQRDRLPRPAFSHLNRL